MAQLRLDARHQLDMLKRLGQEVVGFGGERAHFVGGVVAGAEDHNGNVGGLQVGAQPGDDLETVNPWQHQIEQDQMWGFAHSKGNACLAGICKQRRVALKLKRMREHLCDALLVFDHQNGGRSLWQEFAHARLHYEPM